MNRPLMPHRVTLSIAVLFLLAPLRAAFALQTDEIALIVNSNEPAGRQLAQLYATARHIPDNRILELDLPRSDELPFKVYEEQVVPEVREFLRTGHLDAQIKCFVTFYGVPLRIANRVSNAAEGDELDRIRITLRQTVEKLVDPVRKMEELAIRLDPSFHPNTGTDWDHLRIRAEAAFQSVNTQLATFPDPHRGAEVAIELLTALEPLSGMNATVKRAAMEAKLHPTSQPATQQAALESLVDRFRNAIQKKTELEQQRFDPKARDQLRHVVAQNFGTLQWMQLLRDQADYLTTTDSGAAFDSELAMVRLSTYSRSRWRDNPLYYAARRSNEVGATCMVMRLDAPTPDLVKGIIADSIGTEARGLTGKVVLDSRGMGSDTAHAERGLAEYDQSIRDLADLIHQRTKLEVLADDKLEPLPADSADHVALYCGWYSVHQYIPQCKFNPGAVGWHIASFEMLTLHNPDPGWVVGLLNNGVAATLGSVAEPYVQTFPKPADYFPLLLTGKLTLAEVYWRTTPTASWMVAPIGDPLYNPYKTNPALSVDDLPPRLKAAITVPATQP